MLATANRSRVGIRAAEILARYSAHRAEGCDRPCKTFPSYSLILVQNLVALFSDIVRSQKFEGDGAPPLVAGHRPY